MRCSAKCFAFEQSSFYVEILTQYKVKPAGHFKDIADVDLWMFLLEPAPIDPDSIRVMVHPEGVVVFWEPTEPNGIFKDYLIKFNDFGG